MGSSARLLHDAGNDRTLERRSHRQVARRSRLTIRAKLAGAYEQPRALTPSAGARSRLLLFHPLAFGRVPNTASDAPHHPGACQLRWAGTTRLKLAASGEREPLGLVHIRGIILN